MCGGLKPHHRVKRGGVTRKKHCTRSAETIDPNHVFILAQRRRRREYLLLTHGGNGTTKSNFAFVPFRFQAKNKKQKTTIEIHCIHSPFIMSINRALTTINVPKAPQSLSGWNLSFASYPGMSDCCCRLK